MAPIQDAVRALRRGELVAYPTETVYGLGADATDAAAVEGVYDMKGRDREKPLSVAVGSLADARRHVELSDPERRFLEAFCPGPVTLVCSRPEAIPPVVTAGQDRVGLRIPDHPVALELLDRVAPITATSANPSGATAPRDPDGLATSIREGVAVVVPRGEPVAESAGDDPQPQYEPSTVVDVERRTIHRHGAMAGAVETFLDDLDLK